MQSPYYSQNCNQYSDLGNNPLSVDDAFGNASASWLVNKFSTPPKAGKDFSLDNLGEYDPSATLGQFDEDTLGLMASAYDFDFPSNGGTEEQLAYLDKQGIFDLTEYGDITRVSSSKDGIEVYMDSSTLSDPSILKSGLFGREVKGGVGTNGVGILFLMPDSKGELNQQLAPYRERLSELNNTLNLNSYYIEAPELWINPRSEQNYFSLGASVSLSGSGGKMDLSTDLFADEPWKLSYSSPSYKGFNIDAGNILGDPAVAISHNSGGITTAVNSKGTFVVGALDQELNFNLLSSNPNSSGHILNLDNYQGKSIGAPSIRLFGSKGDIGTSIGKLEYSAGLSFNPFEFADRVVDGVRLPASANKLRIDSINHQDKLLLEINKVKAEMQQVRENFIPQQKKITIYVNPWIKS